MNYTPDQLIEIFTKVLNNPNLSLKVELTHLPNIPVKPPQILQEDENLDVSKLSSEERLKLAKDPNATVEILQSLAKDEHYNVRSWVAQHPNATVEILQSLARDENSDVRYWVARNPNATVEILQHLSQDEDYDVRYGVSRHPNATVEILQSLARDEYYGVRSGVAQHPNATVEILQSLARDEDSYVREEAIKNLNYKPKTLELTSAQYEALKTLLESSQDEVLKSVKTL